MLIKHLLEYIISILHLLSPALKCRRPKGRLLFYASSIIGSKRKRNNKLWVGCGAYWQILPPRVDHGASLNRHFLRSVHGDCRSGSFGSIYKDPYIEETVPVLYLGYSVNRGDVVAIPSPSGSGKTTPPVVSELSGER